jgi:hypothetical protein
MRTRIIVLLVSAAWPVAGVAAVEDDGAEWVGVGPPASGMRVDLGSSRQWVAYGPQALVRTRIAAGPDRRGAVTLQMEMLVNCENQTIAILDTEGLDARGERVFAQSEKGTPMAVGSDKTARALMEAACSPPTIRVQTR